MQIFISYAKEDTSEAKKLFQSLRKFREISPWLDSENLLPGMDWEEEISNAIEKSRFVILVLSSNSVTKTGFLQKEVKKAIDRLLYFPPGKIFIIPIRIDICEPKYAELRKIHYVDMFPDWDIGIKKIVASILSEADSRKLLDEVLSNYKSPVVKEQWDVHAKSLTRYPIQYITGNTDENIKAFAEVLNKIDIGVREAEAAAMYSSKYHTRHETTPWRDRVILQIWKMVQNIVSNKESLFVEDLSRFQDVVAQELKEGIIEYLGLSLLESDKTIHSLIEYSLNALYSVIDVQVADGSQPNTAFSERNP
jgi:hypothetical protein